MPVPAPRRDITLIRLGSVNVLRADSIVYATTAARGGDRAGVGEARGSSLRTGELADAVLRVESVDAVAVEKRVSV